MTDIVFTQSPAISILIVSFEWNTRFQLIGKKHASIWLVLILNNSIAIFAHERAQDATQVLWQVAALDSKINVWMLSRRNCQTWPIDERYWNGELAIASVTTDLANDRIAILGRLYLEVNAWLDAVALAKCAECGETDATAGDVKCYIVTRRLSSNWFNKSVLSFFLTSHKSRK